MKLKAHKRPHQGDRYRTVRKNPDGTREVASRYVGIAPLSNKPSYR